MFSSSQVKDLVQCGARGTKFTSGAALVCWEEHGHVGLAATCVHPLQLK